MMSRQIILYSPLVLEDSSAPTRDNHNQREREREKAANRRNVPPISDCLPVQLARVFLIGENGINNKTKWHDAL